MDRSTTLQRVGLAIGISILIALYFWNVDIFQYKNPETQKTYFFITVCVLALFYLLNKQPLSKICFDYKNDSVTYYRFLLFKKQLPLSSISSAEGQTKTERKYGQGKSKTIYVTDVFLITAEKDFQVRVFERAKINEFKNKFHEAKNLLKSQTE